MIRRHFKLDSHAEQSVEIDPRRLSHAQVVALRTSGFTRASLGVQDFDPTVQLAIHRIQPRAMTDQAIRWLREEGFTSINVDLIYGLPYQTVASFTDTLDQVLELNPNRLAVFSYAHVPWMKPAQKLLEREDALPSPETKLEMLKVITETLTSRGYVYVGMDHFARETDELAVAQAARTLQRNFQGYSTRAGTEILAFGISAISQTPFSYRQNHKTLDHYYAALDRGELPARRGLELTGEDARRREIIMRVMCHLRLDYAELSRELDCDFAHDYSAELSKLQSLADDGLVTLYPTEMQVTDLGRLFLRNIAVCFDAYYTPEAKRHSRTV
jgi:oxygen-independent coproporphyrinogen-3 oxidase